MPSNVECEVLLCFVQKQQLQDISGPGSVVGIATAYGLDRPVVESRWGEIVYTGFWWGNLRERNHLEDPGVDGRIIF